MAPSHISPQPEKSAFWPVWLAVLASIAARAWILFSTPFVPGINGAYYLVQARSLLEKGTLGIPDLPLTFTLQATLAKVIIALLGPPQEQAILTAVKLADAIFPAFLAIPVFLLIRHLKPPSRFPWLATGLAAATALSSSLLSMVGEFQKNSLGLVWLVFLILSLFHWLTNPSRKTTAWVVLFMALGSVTHIGVFGSMCLLTALTLALTFVKSPFPRRHTLTLAISIVLACSLSFGVVLFKFDPSRVHRLIGAFSNPVAFFQDHKHFQQNRSFPNPAPPSSASQDTSKPSEMPSGMPFPPGMGPGGNPFMRFVPSTVLLSFAALSLLLLWRKRATLTEPIKLTVLATALTLIALTGPWVTGDKPMRFQLIAVPLAVLLAAFITANLTKRWTRALLLTPLLTGLLFPSWNLLKPGGHPTLSNEAFAELQSIATKIPNPDTALLVARHGLEWWAAWFLHTKIAQPTAVRESDWTNFQSVFYLKQLTGMRPPNMSGFLMFRPPMFPSGPPPGNGFQATPSQGGPPSGRPPFHGGPMSDPDIPKNAPLIHQGTYFEMARVETPPPALNRSPDQGRRLPPNP